MKPGLSVGLFFCSKTVMHMDAADFVFMCGRIASHHDTATAHANGGRGERAGASESGGASERGRA